MTALDSVYPQYDFDAPPRRRGINGAAHESGPQLPAPSNPMACAREFLAAEFAHDERPLLVQQGGQLYSWNGACWPALDDRDVRTMAYRFTEHANYLEETKTKAWNPTQRKIADFIDSLRAVAHIPTDTPSPSWLDEGWDDYRGIADGLLQKRTGARPHQDADRTHAALLRSSLCPLRL